MCMISVLLCTCTQVWSIEQYSRAGKAHLTQVHVAHPALSLVTSVECIHLLQSALQSIHKKMGPGSGELPYLAIFRDFIVHSAGL